MITIMVRNADKQIGAHVFHGGGAHNDATHALQLDGRTERFEASKCFPVCVQKQTAPLWVFDRS
jgi:hypothetical protein